MTKITPKIKEELKRLEDEGLSYGEISLKTDIPISTIKYHLCSKEREYRKKRSRDVFKNLSPEQKKINQQRQKEYFKVYFKKRYNNEPEFRQRHIKRVSEGFKKRYREDKAFRDYRLKLSKEQYQKTKIKALN